MPPLRQHVPGWMAGSVTTGIAENLNNEALRFGRNTRIDHPIAALSSRPGASQLTAAINAYPVLRLWRRGDDTTTTYEQGGPSGMSIWRLDANWQNAVWLSDGAGPEALSCANMVDGYQLVHAYFVGDGFQARDTGVSFGDIGVPPPALSATQMAAALAQTGFAPGEASQHFGAPLIAVLADELEVVINACDLASEWTFSDTWDTAGVNEPTIKQEGANSIKAILAAHEVASMTISVDIDLSGFALGNADVAMDDYISFWVRSDKPDQIGYVQIEFELATAAPSLSFSQNYFSLRLDGPNHLNQGQDQWTQIKARKSSFARFGSDGALGWGNVKAVRLRFSNLGSTDPDATEEAEKITIYVDDLRMYGGTDLEGEVSYTCCYQVGSSGARGNPPQNADGLTIYSEPIVSDRRRIHVYIGHVTEGGESHPGGSTLIDNILLYRRVNNGEAVLIARFPHTTATPFLDDITQLETALSPTLETDNDQPPSGGHCIFGPGASNRLFLVVGRNQVNFSKVWQDGENRAENWPRNFNFNIGDGSEKAMCGIATDTDLLVWTQERTYQIRQLGDDLYLPIAIPNSHGIVSQHALTQGDGRVFFLAPDGLYEHVGLTQRRVTEMITPFFAGETVSGILPIDPDYAHLCQLAWYPDPFCPMLSLLYPSLGSTTLDSELILKRNMNTGLYTDIFFDYRETPVTAILSKASNPTQLLGGTSDGRILRIEDHSVAHDAGEPIQWQVRTKSYTVDSPQQMKRFDDLLIDIDSNNQEIEVSVERNSDGELIALGTTTTNSNTGQASFASLTSTVDPCYSLAIDFQTPVTRRLVMRRLSLTGEPLAAIKKGWTSSVLTNRYMQLVRCIWLDITATAQVDVQLITDDLIMPMAPVMPSDYRQVLRIPAPGSSKGLKIQLALSSEGFFALESVRIDIKPLGSSTGFQSTSLDSEKP